MKQYLLDQKIVKLEVVNWGFFFFFLLAQIYLSFALNIDLFAAASTTILNEQ